jgi:hypothetical protein
MSEQQNPAYPAYQALSDAWGAMRKLEMEVDKSMAHGNTAGQEILNDPQFRDQLLLMAKFMNAFRRQILYYYASSRV